MVNYAESKIYKIEPICDHDEGEVYIGSTTKHYLSDRYFFHRMSYDKYKVGYGGRYSAYDLFDKYGYVNCHILLVEHVNANSREELRSREGFYIRTLKCVNKRVAGRTMAEYREDKKEELQQYRKDYYNKNKEYIIGTQKIYSQDNREKINEHKKQYRYDTNTIIDCPCGSKFKKYELSRHVETIRHKNFETVLKGEVIETVIKEVKRPDQQEYRKANSEKVMCCCGSSIVKYKLKDHTKTKKHLTYLNNINDSIKEP